MTPPPDDACQSPRSFASRLERCLSTIRGCVDAGDPWSAAPAIGAVEEYMHAFGVGKERLDALISLSENLKRFTPIVDESSESILDRVVDVVENAIASQPGPEMGLSHLASIRR